MRLLTVASVVILLMTVVVVSAEGVRRSPVSGERSGKQEGNAARAAFTATPLGTPAACPVTLPSDSQSATARFGPNSFGNEALSTELWPQGRVVFEPGGPGFIGPDGSLTMKFPWVRLVRGQLPITGRRLDAPGPPLQADIPEGYGDSGFQATALIFPTESCWEVTGRVGDASLTFVTLVVQVGNEDEGQPAGGRCPRRWCLPAFPSATPTVPA